MEDLNDLTPKIEKLGFVVTNSILMKNPGTPMCSHLKVLSKTSVPFYVKLDERGCVTVPENTKILSVKNKEEIAPDIWMNGDIIYETDNVACQIIENEGTSYFCSNTGSSDYKIMIAYPAVNLSELLKSPKKTYEEILNRTDIIREKQSEILGKIATALQKKMDKVSSKIAKFSFEIVTQLNENLFEEITHREKIGASLGEQSLKNEKYYDTLDEASKLNYLSLTLDKIMKFLK